MNFIPIKTLSNIIPLNQRFRALFSVVTEILERLTALECGSVAESVVTEPVKEFAPVVVEPVKKDDGRYFNWKECDSATELKAYAAKKWGLEIKGNKKPETIIAEIDEYLKTKEV